MHTKEYRNCHFHISLTTDSDFFFQAVDEILDFDHAEQPSTNPITIAIDIRESRFSGSHDQNKYLYDHRFEDNDVLGGWLGHPLGHIFSDPKQKTIRGFISSLFKPDEFSLERVLDIALFQPLRYILSFHGYFFLHGSVVYNANGGILFTGPQNCGKSTLAIALLAHAFSYSNDDKVFLHNDETGITLIPLPTKIGIGNQQLPVWQPFLEKSTLSLYGNKKRFSANNLTSGITPEKLYTKMIVFPSFEKGTPQGKITILSKEEAFQRFLQENFNLPDKQLFSKSTPEQMMLFWKLLDHSHAILVTYNDENLLETVSSLADTLNATKS
ncbi:MAG TPA: hypothetical protein PKL77_04365 [Candidatus Omnitrophota bacterium]|nr:hypothetical protein [Candidatus Omnitrophota bacterium]HPT07468.1 hypothetical protein [Candidatus Omnitrophota bacterium]